MHVDLVPSIFMSNASQTDKFLVNYEFNDGSRSLLFIFEQNDVLKPLINCSKDICLSSENDYDH